MIAIVKLGVKRCAVAKTKFRIIQRTHQGDATQDPRQTLLAFFIISFCQAVVCNHYKREVRLRKRGTSLLRRVRGKSNRMLAALADRLDCPIINKCCQLHVVHRDNKLS